MKRLLPIVLFISVLLSQHLTEVIKTYENENIKSITSHKETQNRIENVKELKYYENGQKKSESKFKDGKLISEKRWNEDGSVKE